MVSRRARRELCEAFSASRRNNLAFLQRNFIGGKRKKEGQTPLLFPY
jgi:hypothetical protein